MSDENAAADRCYTAVRSGRRWRGFARSMDRVPFLRFQSVRSRSRWRARSRLKRYAVCQAPLGRRSKCAESLTPVQFLHGISVWANRSRRASVGVRHHPVQHR